jgi:tol-pal system protein YbgF
MRAWPNQTFFPFAIACLLAGCAVPLPAGPVPAVDRTEIARLDTAHDELARQLQQLQDQLLRLEARQTAQQQALAELRRSLAAEKVTPSGQMTAPAVPVSIPGAGPLSPTEVYRQAFSDYAAGRYPQASQGFTLFLQNFPGSDYAGNALYWLAECHFAQQQYAEAAKAFALVADNYMNSGKAPDALLKLAETQLRLGDSGSADETLRRLRSRYPDSTAARQSPPSP